jgi:hypothetical protein
MLIMAGLLAGSADLPIPSIALPMRLRSPFDITNVTALISYFIFLTKRRPLFMMIGAAP